MPRTFLVLEPDILVAQDIGETLVAASPGAAVTHAGSVEEALALAHKLPRIDLAVLHLSNGKIRDSGLDRALSGSGTNLLVLGDEELAHASGDGPEERSASTWQRVGLPFTSAMILNALERLGLRG